MVFVTGSTMLTEQSVIGSIKKGGDVMAQVKADFSSIDMLIKSVVHAEKNIKHLTTNISDPSKCSGIMISAYVDRIRRISRLLRDYKELLEKDATDFENSKDKIAEMDIQLKNLYNSNT